MIFPQIKLNYGSVSCKNGKNIPYVGFQRMGEKKNHGQLGDEDETELKALAVFLDVRSPIWLLYQPVSVGLKP